MHMFNEAVLWLQLHSVLLMLAVFMLIVITTYWPGRRPALECHGMIPLDDDCSKLHDDR